MTEEQAQLIANFRYGVIAPVVVQPLERGEQARILRELAAKEYSIPFRKATRVHKRTLERWLQCYRKGGLDALKPTGRADRGGSRALPRAVLEKAEALKRELPSRSVPQIIAMLQLAGEVDARRQFDHAFLDAYENQGKEPVLVIDEAHLLSTSMLAEVRFLTNFRFDSLSPFALILVGQPELRSTLRLRTFEAIRQRVGVRYHLSGLQESETKAYIEHALKQAGATRPLFTDAAISQIHTIARGIPRVTNTLSAACLLDVCAQNGQAVDTENVHRAQLEYEQI